MKIALAALLLLTAGPALADTSLHLSETGYVTVAPDEVLVTLRAQADGATAAEVQARVNAMVAKALAAAKAVPGVGAQTGSYVVGTPEPGRQPGPRPIWHAAQSIALRGHDSEPMLNLVGLLQGQGLATGQLVWRVSPASQRKAQAEAMQQALRNLKQRADDAAATLGLRFVAFKEVRLDGQSDSRPMMRSMSAAAPMAMAGAAPPPSLAAEDVTIEAVVTAEVTLAPLAP